MTLIMDKPALTEDGIRALVDAFYARVRVDPVLGPVFARAIPGDWQPHLEKMYAFWSSVMLTSGRYKGNPMAAHLKHPIKPEFFDRWLGIWHETTREVFAAEEAARFDLRAENIAASLKLALFYRPDALRVRSAAVGGADA